ncbi:hypothetical protein [Rhodoferax sp. GW822-FHT02A01]|uniref:hypothetical protein n=1 Tax=Rhodoferax sp. GW822-FHT02A01 TaxID=3141537 RepID=UPI00315DBFF5
MTNTTDSVRVPTPEVVAEANSVYLPTPELIAAKDAVIVARKQAEKLRQRVDESAADIVTQNAELDRLTRELSEKQADRALADDDQVKALDAEIKKLIDKVDAKSRELNRTRNLIEALEVKAPEVDAAVVDAQQILGIERHIWSEVIIDAIRDELEAAVRPLIGVMAKAKAFGRFNGFLSDFLNAAWVPADPKSFLRAANGAYAYNIGRNLLDGSPDDAQRAHADAIVAAVAPIYQQLNMKHAEYVPLDKRPKPYVKKGYTMRGQAADETPFGQASKTDTAPEPAATPAKKLSMEDLDIEMGHKLVKNLMRDGTNQTSIQQ